MGVRPQRTGQNRRRRGLQNGDRHARGGPHRPLQTHRFLLREVPTGRLRAGVATAELIRGNIEKGKERPPRLQLPPARLPEGGHDGSGIGLLSRDSLQPDLQGRDRTAVVLIQGKDVHKSNQTVHLQQGQRGAQYDLQK